MWLTWRQALGLASSDLSLPLVWEGDAQRRDELRPVAPLRKVAGRDIYASFLSWATTSRPQFHAFAYDWRRDNLETVGKLIASLEALRDGTGSQKVQVVAHSMGGLISLVALNRCPELFHSVLFAGVPFQPFVGFLQDMHAGAATGLNRRILSPKVLFTYVWPYCLFPEKSYESGLVEANGDVIAHDWYSADDWQRRRLGVFGILQPAEITEQHRTHLRNALRRAKQLETWSSVTKNPLSTTRRSPSWRAIRARPYPLLSTTGHAL